MSQTTAIVVLLIVAAVCIWCGYKGWL